MSKVRVQKISPWVDDVVDAVVLAVGTTTR